MWLFDQIITEKFFLDYLQKWKTWAVSVGESQVCPGYSGLSLFPSQRKHRARRPEARQHSLVQPGRRLQSHRLRSGFQYSGGRCPPGSEWRWEIGVSWTWTLSACCHSLTGYRAPETKMWNKWKEMQSNKRRRKLQGSFSRINLTNVTGLVSR